MNLEIIHCKHGHEFTKENTYIRKNGSRRCLACNSRIGKERRNRMREAGTLSSYYRDTNLKYSCGFDQEEYKRRLKFQGNKCANTACGYTPKPGEHLHIDHDHKCCGNRKTCGKCTRGLLCSRCNLILGQANDDQTYLAGLIKYLEV